MAEDSLEPLITQCPTCRTRFRVTESQLNVAAGRVRCGACLSVFAGLEHLVLGAGPRLNPGETANEALDALLDELRKDPEPAPVRARSTATEVPTPRKDPASAAPEPSRASTELLANSRIVADEASEDARESRSAKGEADASGAVPSGDAAPPAIDPVAARKARRLRLAAANAPRPTPPAEQEQEDLETRREEEQPDVELERAAPPSVDIDIRPEDLIGTPRWRRRRWWMPVVLVLGAVLLTGQVLYLQFDAWAKNPDIRPVYEWLCPRLHCQLPVMRSLDEIRSKNLVVRANPDVPGELMVDALIVNQARFEQPFPVIELRFSSMDGRPIAARRFKPEEYLAGELKGATMFAPLTPVHIALAIEDPGTDAVSYYIQFR